MWDVHKKPEKDSPIASDKCHYEHLISFIYYNHEKDKPKNNFVRWLMEKVSLRDDFNNCAEGTP